MSFEKVSERFQHFVTQETASSPLYSRLSLAVAADPAILSIAARARPGQPLPNMLFGAVHYLLLQDASDPLAAFYPDLNSEPNPPENVYPYFRAFCLANQPAIEELLETRLVQTNEVQRCVCLMPLFGVVARSAGTELALVEIGTSAGLNLLWDRYGYDYNAGGQYGDLASSLILEGILRGSRQPPFPASWPEIKSRVGLDLNPLQLDNPADMLWLRALIWPEHLKRAGRLETAIRLAQANRPEIIAGNALDTLPAVLQNTSPEATLCLFHSFTLNQFSPQMRQSLWSLLADFSRQRKIYVISFESQREGFPQLSLTQLDNGQATDQVLARADPHGSWLEWLT